MGRTPRDGTPRTAPSVPLAAHGAVGAPTPRDGTPPSPRTARGGLASLASPRMRGVVAPSPRMRGVMALSPRRQSTTRTSLEGAPGPPPRRSSEGGCKRAGAASPPVPPVGSFQFQLLEFQKQLQEQELVDAPPGSASEPGRRQPHAAAPRTPSTSRDVSARGGGETSRPETARLVSARSGGETSRPETARLVSARGGGGGEGARPGPERPEQAPAQALLLGQLEQALAQHTAALREATARQEAELTQAAMRIGQEFGRAIGEALLRGQELAASTTATPTATTVESSDRDVHPRVVGRTRLPEPSTWPSSPPSAGASVVSVDLAKDVPSGPYGSDSAGIRGGSPPHRGTSQRSSTSVALFVDGGLPNMELFERAFAGATKWFKEEEPQRSGTLAEVVKSRRFDFICNLVILLNCVFVVWSANHSVGDPNDHDVIVAFEYAFTVFYCCELVSKLWVHRWFYFRGDDAALNTLDFLLVFLAGVEMIVLPLFATSSGAVDPTFLRILRVFKVVKVLRMLRALHAFKDIRVMIDCLVHSFWPLVWACALLGFLSALFAIYFVQSVGAAVTIGKLSPADEIELLKYFGTVELAMFTLLVVTTGGHDWILYFRVLEPLGWFACVVFVVYIMFMFLAVMNIVTSVFLDKAMDIAKPASDNVMLDKCYTDLEDADELTRMVSTMDAANDGLITFPDFARYMREPEFRKYFESRSLTQKDVRMLFRMLASYDGTPRKGGERTVDLAAFLAGCMRLKGEASGMDMYTLGWGLRLTRAAQADLGARVEEQLAELRGHLGVLAAGAAKSPVRA